jgi:hypothetical protein
MDFNKYKIVLWGHKLHSHTHSYVHYAFHKAAKHMGYESYWLDNEDEISGIDLENSIFITEGQVDQKIPIRDDCFYVLHNCYDEKYKKLFISKKAFVLQVYTNAILQYNYKKFNDFIQYDIDGQALYFPWGTDLLPHEIDLNFKLNKNSKVSNWIGTMGGGEFGNINELQPFINACNENGIKFNHSASIEFEDNIRLIKESFAAPAIVGTWQKKVGYIPCRIFKNISYGHIGSTNSETVNKLFNNKLIYNQNEKDLFFSIKNYINSSNDDLRLELINEVKNNHTYVNRIETILNFIELYK